eukprot:scaffold63585_cov58-Phaeocystis_antarctica.AAC.1
MRGSMAPARAMASVLSASSKARLPSAAAAASCAPALSPLKSATRGSMAPARAMTRALVTSEVTSAQAAAVCAVGDCGGKSGRPRAAVLCAPEEQGPVPASRMRSIAGTARPTRLERVGDGNGLWRRAGETWSWPNFGRTWVGARRPKRVSYGCPTKPTQRQVGGRRPRRHFAASLLGSCPLLVK